MNTSNIAFLDESPKFSVREDRRDYGVEADHVKHLYEAQRLVGEALNLAGLVLKSLEDEGDARAMQIHTALRVLEKKLTKACRRIDRYGAYL